MGYFLILSNSTRKMLWFEITKMLIAVLKNKFTVLFIIVVPYFHFPAFSALPDNDLTRSVSEMIKVREIATTEYDS